MWKGRTVMVYDEPRGTLLRVFNVGIEDPVEAVAAVLRAYPHFSDVYLEAGASIEAIAVAYSELEPGEVRGAVRPIGFARINAMR